MGGEGGQGALGDRGGQVEGEGGASGGFCSGARQLEAIGSGVDDVVETAINQGQQGPLLDAVVANGGTGAQSMAVDRELVVGV